MGPVVSGFLSQPEIEKLYDEVEIKGLRAEMVRWWDNDCLCFGLKLNENVVAYMWCNLRRCDSDFGSFPLQQDEAYLFWARAMNADRGRNLASFLKYKLYERLFEMGRTRYYSITEYFNTPAANLKKKLKAAPLKLRLYF